MQYLKSPERSTAGFVHYACLQRPPPICSIKTMAQGITAAQDVQLVGADTFH